MDPRSYLTTLIADVGTVKEQLDELPSIWQNPYQVKFALMHIGDRLEYVLAGIKDILKEV